MNGIEVPEWLASQTTNQINPKEFAKIKNVEVRREFVRKIGMERILEHIPHKMLDKQGNYNLLLIDLGDEVGNWPYLKMLNPSIGCWHLECVSQECTTIQEAINFRASKLKSLKGNWKPS